MNLFLFLFLFFKTDLNILCCYWILSFGIFLQRNKHKIQHRIHLKWLLDSFRDIVKYNSKNMLCFFLKIFLWFVFNFCIALILPITKFFVLDNMKQKSSSYIILFELFLFLLLEMWSWTNLITLCIVSMFKTLPMSWYLIFCHPLIFQAVNWYFFLLNLIFSDW